MAGIPFDWNVVVRGSWNPAILTPTFIATRLFDVEATPMEVLVVVDAPVPAFQVKHRGLLVAPTNASLLISASESTKEQLHAAAALAQRAITTLPETPLTAAGVNLRYRFESIPDRLLAALNSSLDERLSDTDHRIAARSMMRQLPWRKGVLNLQIDCDEDASGLLQFNFHRGSANKDHLLKWLGRSDDMLATAGKLISETLKLTIDEAANE